MQIFNKIFLRKANYFTMIKISADFRVISADFREKKTS